MTRPVERLSIAFQSDKHPHDYAELGALVEGYGFGTSSVYADLLFQPPLAALLLVWCFAWRDRFLVDPERSGPGTIRGNLRWPRVAGAAAIAVVIGYKVNDWRFGYSYDITISRLAAQSGGAHEITMVYELADKRKRKRMAKRRVVPCAKF